ncbi:unnamed protein product [Fusarium graminearum]|uniref:Uncharacterized protein n=2 Tax=Fusarium sambucinum species complex TaxID=569360 RepID=A0A2H3FI91_GIBZA|nr:hypothetical protein FAUST_10458 [Fusarium austroamericanum]KAI6767134.1 hypothetical protein HG531_011494 [Fusarium graminearum]PCD19817.1 hypothetical protein FGRA07_05566 [Fusarium graminearum]CAF3468327.1 unnamed protein product [Fusarium graminearum]CAF3473915.1 unnamed protein product [Fusarium graminearum]
MTADQDVYRKTGRGGAGNYVVQNKADDADKVKLTANTPFILILKPPQDLEAQSLATDEVPPPDRATANVPARAGRGGSGNYVNPSDLPDAAEQDEMARKTAAAVNASLMKNQAVRGGGLGGRGGAGNWKHAISFEEEERMREEEKSRGEALEKKVRETVEKGLKMPEKVHHGPQHVKRNED